MSVNTSLLTEGVSEDLARHRQQTLSAIAYKIEFDIPQEQSEAIPARETITFDRKKNAGTLILDFKEEQDHLKQIRANNRMVPVLFEKEHIVVEPKYLKEGTNTLSIEFIAGNLSLNRNEEFLYTLFVPDRARTVFPCFDQPDLKATYEVSLTIPRDWKAVTNAPLADSVVSDQRHTYHFQPSDRLPTYLFSFVAGKFKSVSRVLNDREMTLYHRETDTSKIRGSLDPIFTTHAAALNFLENYTQIPYPFQKFDFAAVPDFQYGGMEHAGAIQYKAASLFLDEGATRNQKLSRTKLLAHETAHMWFGDLVTMRWFNDVWMKEVFANFMADKVAKDMQPESSYELEFLISHFPAAYSIDRTEGPNPIGQPLNNLNQAGTMYGPIIYHKAPIMMRQLERLMGKEAMRNGLREYLKTYAFGNAAWPDLIAILDRFTLADLAAWNHVWVNETGRPTFDYTLDVTSDAGKSTIKNLTINQKSEDGSDRTWPQLFEIALVFPDHVEELTVDMKEKVVTLPQALGKEVPEAILFNSSGQGYGLFPATDLLSRVSTLPSPLMRAAGYINLYENMVGGSEGVSPASLAKMYVSVLTQETEELTLGMITDHISDIYWQFLLPPDRQAWSQTLEEEVWQAMKQVREPNKKKILFKLYQNVALSQPAQDRLYALWKEEKAPTGVKLTEDDYTAMALALALRDFPVADLLEQQLARVKNPDRRKRLSFMLPALSADSTVRDAFFNALKDEKNRERESWVTASLGYLHHPLRAATSHKYLRASLDLLEEIQKTGDIFFPEAWLRATLGPYQSTAAKDVVRLFLLNHPEYNPRLKAKLLQAADPLFRAERILSHEK